MGGHRVHSLRMAGLDGIGWCVGGWVGLGNGMGAGRQEV